MYLRASEMSKQAWSEAVKTNNLEEHMLLDPLFVSTKLCVLIVLAQYLYFSYLNFNRLQYSIFINLTYYSFGDKEKIRQWT